MHEPVHQRLMMPHNISSPHTRTWLSVDSGKMGHGETCRKVTCTVQLAIEQPPKIVNSKAAYASLGFGEVPAPILCKIVGDEKSNQRN
jgi:hypothetical protein